MMIKGLREGVEQGGGNEHSLRVVSLFLVRRMMCCITTSFLSFKYTQRKLLKHRYI